MKTFTRRQIGAILAGGIVVAKGCRRREPVIRREWKYAPAPADNPMKGFVPIAGDWGDAFPHSLEWADFPLNAIMKGPGRFEFDGRFADTLAEIAGRGHQAILRIYLDYPGRPTGVPRFLIDAGLRMTRYENDGGGQSPDYRNEDLITALTEFIGAFGGHYDGDAHIACVTLGLLGFRGGWHTRPLDGLMADPLAQRKIMTAYAEAFSRTRLTMPDPRDDALKWPIGLDDEAFGGESPGRIQAAGAEDLWKTQPIGGKVWPETPEVDDRDLADCVRSTRASWLVNQHLFEEKVPDEEYQRALTAARLLGYELHLPAVEAPAKVTPGGTVALALEIENRGVAPLYADWKIRLRLEDGDASAESIEMPGDLKEILPGESPRKWTTNLRAPDPTPAGGFRIRLIPPRAFPGAPPLRFANAGLEADGSLLLAEYGSDGAQR